LTAGATGRTPPAVLRARSVLFVSCVSLSAATFFACVGDLPPTITGAPDDGLTLYYRLHLAESTRVMKSTRSTTNDGFGIGNPITELDGAGTTFVTWVSKDDCVMYLVSNREGKGFDVSSARRGN
jgi:hypothetical protein